MKEIREAFVQANKTSVLDEICKFIAFSLTSLVFVIHVLHQCVAPPVFLSVCCNWGIDTAACKVSGEFFLARQQSIPTGTYETKLIANFLLKISH